MSRNWTIVIIALVCVFSDQAFAESSVTTSLPEIPGNLISVAIGGASGMAIWVRSLLNK